MEVPLKRKHWTPEEDEAIRILVGRERGSKWTEISKKLAQEFGLPGRTGKQCRERWFNHLSPDIKKDPWTAEEQSTLLKLHKQMGNIWARISTFLPGRSENAVKNQFYSLLRRQFRKNQGCEPTINNLKKHDLALSTQLLASLHKKIRHKGRRNTPHNGLDEDGRPKSIDLMVPLEQHSEHSTLLDEHDFFVPIEHHT